MKEVCFKEDNMTRFGFRADSVCVFEGGGGLFPF